MRPQKLPPIAENIRLEIKEKIPELSKHTVEKPAEILKIDEDGNKTYGGDVLAKQISLLSGQLPISDPENWGYCLLYFAVPTIVTNKRERGFFIPLSEKTLRGAVPEEGISQEGFYFYFESKPQLQVNSKTGAIYVVPR
ncbi:hypothetical protein BO94DRAFT_474406 [Aspergillus sclerotioniger CBS 115572]|uniref:Uncharacterized protein n=1 Tax=Aspergillus sclerotioniger CBS 115572 TaxID=1450535 RepID=A0A317VQU3_9EURO|nr:hypothetical protein BO94DRAFT_474406 [Aspergillus sclerotioniger CBS 115572]PWY75278.1 hypothetical protein BO94DRAFT_474406 [Aspergillus sclerotioniger CBS 115572]